MKMLCDISFNQEKADPSTWFCTDGLGRTLAAYDTAGPVRKNKYVGLFYWTWHFANSDKGTANITEVLREHPGIEGDYESPYWGSHPTYFWDEPLFGYYTKDKWVYRKHAELLAAAGIDVIFFDCTNGTRLFLDALELLAEAFEEAREEGIAAPCFAFFLPWGDEADAIDLREMYEKIYSIEKYKDLWFYWKGKPLVLGTYGGLSQQDPTDQKIASFFTFRAVQASYFEGQTLPEQWGWLAVYPQTTYTIYGEKEEISVGAAQNYCKETGLTAMNGRNVYGRTHTVQNGKDTSDQAVFLGANLKEQFEYALQQDPEFIFVTGWNEWIAGRFDCWEGVCNAFPDEFTPEYSRDIEPSAGILKDYYYYQLADYVRRFKGVQRLDPVPPCRGICIDGPIEQWNSVMPYYPAFRSNSFERDAVGFLNIRYTNRTGRNIIVGAKIAYDQEYLYFFVETTDELTSSSDHAWMRLYFSIVKTEASEYETQAGWETFHYVLNRIPPDQQGALLEQSLGGWNWEEVGRVAYAVQKNTLQIKIPFTYLGIANDPFEIRFKWSDNCDASGDIMNFYTEGCTAPIGRFQYCYFASGAAAGPAAF